MTEEKSRKLMIMYLTINFIHNLVEVHNRSEGVPHSGLHYAFEQQIIIQFYIC